MRYIAALLLILTLASCGDNRERVLVHRAEVQAVNLRVDFAPRTCWVYLTNIKGDAKLRVFNDTHNRYNLKPHDYVATYWVPGDSFVMKKISKREYEKE